jgi:hypothetical protein
MVSQPNAVFSPRWHAGGNQRQVRLLVSDGERISPTLLPSIHTLLIAALSRAPRCIAAKTLPRQGLLKMLTPVQQHAVDQFAKSLPALGDDALIDTYHQAWEDHRAACAEDSDNHSKAYAKSLATEKAMRDRFPDYQGRYRLRYP